MDIEAEIIDCITAYRKCLSTIDLSWFDYEMSPVGMCLNTLSLLVVLLGEVVEPLGGDVFAGRSGSLRGWA